MVKKESIRRNHYFNGEYNKSSPNRATKILATSFCILGGITSIVHGIFEVLQGNAPLEIGRILAIGPAHRMWEYGGEPALTIIPNYLITGIMSIVISVSVFIWAIAFIDRRYNLSGVIVLTVLMLLFGGGFASPTFMMLAIITTIFINRPVKIFTSITLGNRLKYISILWPLSLYLMIIFVVIALIAGVCGYPFLFVFEPEIAINVLRFYGLIVTFIFGPITILSAMAFDAES